MQEHILVKQTHIIQQNKKISESLVEITYKFEVLVEENKVLSSVIGVADNTSKLFEESHKKNKKVVELERSHHKLQQYSQRECLELSGIPTTVIHKELEDYIIEIAKNIGIILDRSKRVAKQKRFQKSFNK